MRDGGGIKPDVEVKPDSFPTIVYDLVASDEFFDWCTDFVAHHPDIAPAGSIRLTDEEYGAFVDSIKASGFSYNRRSDEVLRLLRDVARKEGYLEGAEAEFDALQAKFTTDITHDLSRSRKDIEPYITDELAVRYYGQRGAVEQQLMDDPCLERSLGILASPTEYGSILGRGSQGGAKP